MKQDRLVGTDWHFRPDESLSLSCARCFLLEICGGLHVKGGALDCQRFCCGKKDCKIVCFNSPVLYSRRLLEIKGFELNNVPHCTAVAFDKIHGYIPLLHHAYSRRDAFEGEQVALSLFELLNRDGSPKYLSREDVVKNFRFSNSAKLIVSSINKDHLLERLWETQHRRSIALMLKSIGVSIFTSPNFSVYNNVPRPENLYNIKRIVLLAQEFLSEGVPTALHINAVTDRDYQRFTEFLVEYPEFQALSFDFITGPGYPSRTNWHIKKLIELSKNVGRPMQLLLRGGTRALFPLSSVFRDLAMIDSDPLQRALHRQLMIFGNDGQMKSVKNKLPKGVPVDDLLSRNVRAAEAEVEFMLRNPKLLNRAAKNKIRSLAGARNGNHETRQLNFLSDAGVRQSGALSNDGKGVVAAPKSKSAADVQKTAK